MTLIRATDQRRVVVGEERFFLVDCTNILDLEQTQTIASATVAEVTTTDIGGTAENGVLAASVNGTATTINGRTVAANRSLTLTAADTTAINFDNVTAGNVYILTLTMTLASPAETVIGAIEIEVEASPT